MPSISTDPAQALHIFYDTLVAQYTLARQLFANCQYRNVHRGRQYSVSFIAEDANEHAFNVLLGYLRKDITVELNQDENNNSPLI
jgi:hypothetical protein